MASKLYAGGRKPGSRGKAFYCRVVSETVSITLRRKHIGFGTSVPFVQCSESDCQYVDANAPPCPLNLGLFSEEIEAQKERRARIAGTSPDDRHIGG